MKRRDRVTVPISILLLILAILILASLAGCASPYLDVKYVVQHDRGSDWVLQPERPWIDGSNNRLHISAGLEWEKQFECYIESIVTGPYNWTGVGCAKRFGRVKDEKLFAFFFEPALVHQVDEWSDDFISTDQKQWQGHNPFLHLRGGIIWKNGIRCPVIASGKSLFQGAPFESEDHAPDLYWVNVECSARIGGRNHE